MEDENDPDDEYEFDLGNSRSDTLFGGMFDTMFFDSDINHEHSEELKLAVRLMKSSETIHEFIDYVEENDIDLDELNTFLQKQDITNAEQRDTINVVIGYISLASAIGRLGSFMEDDDDDNPFKVSDGDDPIY